MRIAGTLIICLFTLVFLGCAGDGGVKNFMGETGSTISGILNPGCEKSDFNGDRKVDFDDFYILKKSYGTKKGEENYDERADINKDGEIDMDDFDELKKCYNVDLDDLQ